MKKSEDLNKDIPDANKWEPALIAAENGLNAKVARYLRKFIYLTSLAGIALFFNACIGGYVATEPVYVEVARPPQPSNLHIWIDGDWIWSSQTHAYAHKDGYWEKPNQGKTYVSGHWQATARGRYWVPGQWQRQSRQKDHSNR